MKNNVFMKKVILLVTGTAAGQLLIIATMPIITRIYSPESFGLFSVITSIVGILAVISSLRYEMSIPLIKDKYKRENIVILSLISIIIFSILAFLILLFNSIFDFISINPYFYFIPIAVFFTGLYQLLVNISVVNNKLKEISITRFNQSFTQVVVQLSGYFFNGAILFLFLGFLVGRFTGILKLIKSNKLSLEIFNFYEKKIMKETAYKYKEFPMYSLPSSFINSLGVNGVPILILVFYGPAVAGMFALTNRIISAPMQLIGKAFNNALFNEAPNLTPSQLKPFFWKTVTGLFALMFLPVILIYFLEPIFFTKVFGVEWAMAGKMLRILIFMFWFQFSIIPMTEILTIIGKQKIRFYWDIMRLVIVLASFIVPKTLGLNVMTTLTVYSVSMILCYIILVMLCAKELNNIKLEIGEYGSE